MVGLERVRFVHRDRELVGRINRLARGVLPLEMQPPLDVSRGANCWIAQTFIHLRRLGYPVRLASTCSWREMNVAHYDHLGWRHLPVGAFVVAVRADRPPPMLGDLRVVQNELGIEDAGRDNFIPLWSQPGLIPRDPARGDRMTALGYFGLAHYLAAPLRAASFRERLAALGVDFRARYRPQEWSDHREVDAVVAIREASDLVLSIKPATKLVNAWKAGCIPILGREPAYRQIGRPGVDYLEASSVEEVIRAVEWIRERPIDAARLRQEGGRAATVHDDDALGRRWIAMLEGVALPAFERWQRAGMLGHLLELPARLVAHRREATSFWARVNPSRTGPA